MMIDPTQCATGKRSMRNLLLLLLQAGQSLPADRPVHSGNQPKPNGHFIGTARRPQDGASSRIITRDELAAPVHQLLNPYIVE